MNNLSDEPYSPMPHLEPVKMSLASGHKPGPFSSQQYFNTDASPGKQSLLDKEGLSLVGTMLAFVSTIVGGGIVSIPYAYI